MEDETLKTLKRIKNQLDSSLFNADKFLAQKKVEVDKLSSLITTYEHHNLLEERRIAKIKYDAQVDVYNHYRFFTQDVGRVIPLLINEIKELEDMQE